MSVSPILVVGSTGKIGRRVAQRLRDGGQSVRAGSRRSDPPFDWQDPSTWAPALRGVDSAYVSYYPDLAVPDAPAAIKRFTEVALQEGVRKLVLLSGRGESNARRSEDIVRKSGLDFTLVRASWFNQNFDEGQLLEPVLDGVVAMPAAMVREPFVDADDVAEVAVAALTDTGHDGQLYEVTGPRLMTFSDAVAEIAVASGHRVEYAPISLEEFRAGMTEAAGPDLANLLTELCREVFDGRNESVADGVQRALGRAPRDFSDFCRAAAASGAWHRAA